MEGEEHTSNHGHIQRPSLPQYIVHPTEYPLVQNETILLAVPLKATNWKVFHTSISLLSLMSLFYSGSLRTFAKIMMVRALLFILKFYSIKMKKMNLDIEGVEGFDKSQCSIIVYVTFAVCIILRVKASKVHWWNKRQTFLKPTLKDKKIVISRWVFWLAW